MELKDKDIKELFAPFGFKENQDDDSDRWIYLQQKLQKQNFFTFEFRHINIYNTLAIIIAVATLCGLCVSTSDHCNTIGKPNQKKNELKETKPIQQQEKQQSVPLQIEHQSQRKQDDKNNLIKLKHNSVDQSVQATEPKHSAVIKNDNIQIDSKAIPNKTEESLEPSPVIQAEKPKVKTQKTIYKVTTDTILQYDTVKVKTKKRKGLFSK